MEKSIEIRGCIEVPLDTDKDLVIDRFIEFIEKNGWSFGNVMEFFMFCITSHIV